MEQEARRRLMSEVVSLAWPAVLQGLVTTVVLFTDHLLLGRYSTEALGSLGIAAPLLWSVFSVFGAYGAGIVAVIGRAVGAGDTDRARATLGAVLGFAAVVGVTVAVLGWALRWHIVEALAGGQTSAAVRTLAASYMEIVFIAAPLQFMARAGSTAMQASGDTRTPMVIGGLAGAVNLVLTWLLVYGHGGLPELGVRGAALGTISAFALQCVLVFVVLGRRAHPLGLRRDTPAAAPPDGASPASSPLSSLGPVLRVSGPAFGEKILYHSAYLVFTALIGHLGDVSLAAHQSLIAIEAISFIAAEGLGVASGALVAQKLGAGRPDEAAATGWLAVRLGAVALSAVTLLFLVWPQACVRIFTDDPEVIALGATCLRIAAIAQPVMAITDALAGALRGAGDTASPMRAALFGPVVVRLAACWLLAYPAGLGLVGIWIGSTLDWIVRATYLGRAFHGGRWRTLRLTE